MQKPRAAAAVLLTAVLLLFQGSGPAAAHDNCSTANADRCINVGESTNIRVTSSLLGLYCLDSKGNPDHELIQLYFSGVPTSGGAGGIFRPQDVITAYETGAYLHIETFEGTRPGNYTVSIWGRGEHCGLYPGFQVLLLVRPTISGGSRLWSFNGAKPPGYPTEVTLTALPANMPPYTWYALGSTFWLHLPNGQNTITTNVNHVTVTAVRPNLPTSARPSIFVHVGGGLSLDHHIDVLTPTKLVLKHLQTQGDANLGYRSIFEFAAFDQLGHRLPATPLPVELVWTSSQTKLFATTNWTRSASGRHALSDPRHIRLGIVPRTDGGLPVDVGIPRPQAPDGGATKIDCWRTAVFLGGDDAHQGVKVDDQIWLRYRDHATTEAAKCP